MVEYKIKDLENNTYPAQKDNNKRLVNADF